MPLIAQRAVMAAKEETVEGTPETLAAADAFLSFEPSFDYDLETHDRNPIRPTLSMLNPVSGRRYGILTFKCELKGSGTAGTAPKFGKLFKFCKMTETIVAVTSVTYTPASTGDPSCTIAFYVDGKRYQLAGARGTWKFTANVGEPVMVEFTFWGKATITDQTLLSSITFDSTEPQPLLNTSLTIHADTSHIAANLEMDIANTLALRPDISQSDGIKSILIPDRRPVGAIQVEERTVADFDYYGRLQNGTLGNFSTVLGATAGNITTITAPQVRFMELGQEFRDGILVLNLAMMFILSSGDDEISIALT